MPSLPHDVLVNRLNEEMHALRHGSTRHFVSRPATPIGEFPLHLEVTLLDTPGPVWDGKELRHHYVHKLDVVIGADYPYVKPHVQWKTPIFHPNVMMPDEGGHACTRLLDGWRFDSTLSDFLELLARLVSAPDPKNAYATPACSAAAQYFAKAPYAAPRSALTRAAGNAGKA